MRVKRKGGSELFKALDALALKSGVRRDSLRTLLDGELAVLKQYFPVDPKWGEEDLRKGLEGWLKGYIAKLGKPDGQLRRPVSQEIVLYQNLVQIGFNIVKDEDFSDLKRDARLIEISHLAERSLVTLQRRFKDALGQIADMIEQDYLKQVAKDEVDKPPVDEPEPSSAAVTFEPSTAVSPSDLTPRTSSPTTPDLPTGMPLLEPVVEPVIESPPAPEAPDGKSSPTPLRSKRLRRTGFVAVGVVVVFSLFLAVRLIAGEDSAGKDEVPPASSSAGSVQSGPGPLLIATVVSVGSSNLNTVFRSERDFDKYHQSVKADGMPESDDLLVRQKQYGAFVHGTLELWLNLEGNTDREVTITNIRPVDIKHEDPVLGVLVYGPSTGTGEPPERMGFLMDARAPTALTVEKDLSYGRPWFDENSTTLPNRSKEVFKLEFTPQATAVTFGVEVAYEVGGILFTERVAGSDGKPLSLHVSADLCPIHPVRPLSAEDVQKLRSKRYASYAAQPDLDAVEQNRYIFSNEDIPGCVG